MCLEEKMLALFGVELNGIISLDDYNEVFASVEARMMRRLEDSAPPHYREANKDELRLGRGIALGIIELPDIILFGSSSSLKFRYPTAEEAKDVFRGKLSIDKIIDRIIYNSPESWDVALDLQSFFMTCRIVATQYRPTEEDYALVKKIRM